MRVPKYYEWTRPGEIDFMEFMQHAIAPTIREFAESCKTTNLLERFKEFCKDKMGPCLLDEFLDENPLFQEFGWRFVESCKDKTRPYLLERFLEENPLFQEFGCEAGIQGFAAAFKERPNETNILLSDYVDIWFASHVIIRLLQYVTESLTRHRAECARRVLWSKESE